jgi:hypothetical protein
MLANVDVNTNAREGRTKILKDERFKSYQFTQIKRLNNEKH